MNHNCCVAITIVYYSISLSFLSEHPSSASIHHSDLYLAAAFPLAGILPLRGKQKDRLYGRGCLGRCLSGLFCFASSQLQGSGQNALFTGELLLFPLSGILLLRADDPAAALYLCDL